MNIMVVVMMMMVMMMMYSNYNFKVGITWIHHLLSRLMNDDPT